MYSTIARSCVRYTREVKLYEHPGNRDVGSRYVHLPGAVSGTRVRFQICTLARSYVR